MTFYSVIAYSSIALRTIVLFTLTSLLGSNLTLLAAETGRLTVRVVDADGGTTIPARLVLRDSNGKYPDDRLQCSADRWPHIEAHAIFIAGEKTFELPAGKTLVMAAHGLQYRAESRSVEIAAGGETTIEIPLKRVVNMRKAGWVAGDLHVHMIHGENQRETSYEDVALTCSANGLDFVSVGQEYVGAGTLDLAGYLAKCREVSNVNFTMLFGGEAPKSLLGHQVLLGASNPFVIRQEPPYFETAHDSRSGRSHRLCASAEILSGQAIPE